jgi:hypothetical protein
MHSGIDPRVEAITKECKRLEESCLYTAASLFSWEREARALRIVFIVAPIILGGIATIRPLLREASYDWLTALFALGAGLFPAIFKALDWDVSVKLVGDSANRFKNLENRFRQLSAFSEASTYEDAKSSFDELYERLEDARASNPTPPERHFKKASKKIKKGHFQSDSQL